MKLKTYTLYINSIFISVFFLLSVLAVASEAVDSKAPEIIPAVPEAGLSLKKGLITIYSVEGIFTQQSTNFYFTPDGAGAEKVDFDSNTSLGFGTKLYTNFGAFSFSLPMNSSGDKDDSETGAFKEYTSSFDVRYDHHLGKNTVIRGKYLRYKGFYEKKSTGETLRKDIELSNYEVTLFGFFTPETFPVQNQSHRKSNFEKYGSSQFVFASLYSGKIVSPNSFLGSSFDIAMGKYAGLRKIENLGASLGWGFGYNYLGDAKNWNFLWSIGAGANIHQQSTSTSLGKDSKFDVGISVSVEMAYNYLFENEWFVGLAANHVTQSTSVAGLDMVAGNMDIKMMIGKSF